MVCCTSEVWIVVTIYNPDLRKLKKLYHSVVNQVSKIVFVCNSPFDEKFLFIEGVFIELNSNLGIAAAQNIGSELALSSGADFVLYSDQDTEYPASYVADLLQEFRQLCVQGRRVAAVGPVFRDINKGNEIQAMVYFDGFQLKKSFSKSDSFSSSHIISSGMIVPVNILNTVGLNRADFFIDWVDTEWCWRARELGYEVFQIPRVIINHEIGDSSYRLFGRDISVHSQIRNYYKLRNIVYLLLHEKFDKTSVRYYSLSVALRIFVLSVLTAEQKTKAILYGFIAIKDGFVRKLGSRNFS